MLTSIDAMRQECDPGNDDLQKLQSSHEGIEGSYLPQETKVEMPPLQPGQDAGAEPCVQAAKAKGQIMGRLD